MPLNKERLQGHLLKASAKGTKPPAIKAAEKIEQDVKKATGVDKVEKEVERNVTKASALDVKAVAEQSLSKLLMRKLLDGSKLTSEEQKQVALVCKQVGFL